MFNNHIGFFSLGTLCCVATLLLEAMNSISKPFLEGLYRSEAWCNCIQMTLFACE